MAECEGSEKHLTKCKLNKKIGYFRGGKNDCVRL